MMPWLDGFAPCRESRGSQECWRAIRVAWPAGQRRSPWHRYHKASRADGPRVACTACTFSVCAGRYGSTGHERPDGDRERPLVSDRQHVNTSALALLWHGDYLDDVRPPAHFQSHEAARQLV
jgi:hypothetical protein